MLSLLVLLLVQGHAATLDEALRSALNKNESVGQSREKVVQAEERLDQAKSGPQPTISFEAQHLIQPELRDPLYREFSPAQQTTANFSLKQPLFRGFREFAALRRQRDLVDAEKANEQTSLAGLYEQVATSFYEILSYEQDLKNLEDQRRLYAERVKNLQARAARGESARNEPLTAQSTEAVTEAEIMVVRTKLKAARENFQILSGLAADTPLADGTVVEEDSLGRVQKLEHYLAAAKNRPDVEAALKNAEAAAEDVKIAKGQHWPTLDLVGNYYVKRPPGFFNELDWDVQFKLSVPLYEGGLRVSQTAEAASAKRSADLTLAKVRRSAESEIRTLHETLMIRINHLKALRRATELSKRNSEILERDFRRGLSRNIDVQAALAEYGVARRNLDQARFAARLDLVRLHRAANILPPAIKEYASKDQQ